MSRSVISLRRSKAALLVVLLFSLFATFASVARAADPIVAGGNGNANTGGTNAGNNAGNNAAAGNQNAGNNANQNAAVSSGAATSAAVNIPSSAAAGGITITQPAQTADASYYKIASGVDVTFAWNFTSVLSYPQNLFVYAFCSDNQNSYPIAGSPSNGLPGTATKVIWNPYNYSVSATPGQATLIQATYRLQIFDERGRSVGASPGLFQPNEKVQFALYLPRAYTPLADGWVCPGCSGASNTVALSPYLIALVSTVVVMVASAGTLFARAGSVTS